MCCVATNARSGPTADDDDDDDDKTRLSEYGTQHTHKHSKKNGWLSVKGVYKEEWMVKSQRIDNGS